MLSLPHENSGQKPTPMFAAIMFGPVEAAIVYSLGDLIGALILPFGPYHPGFTICAAVMGFLFGLFLNKRPLEIFGGSFEWKAIRFFPNMLVPVLINCLVLGLVVNTLWVSQLYGSKTYYGWFLYRLPEYAVLVPVELIFAAGMPYICAQIKKTSVFGYNKAKENAENRLKSISVNKSIPGLSRVTELLSRLGSPQNELKVVHVAGTNGKGSFVAMLSSILREAGYTVGSFSSPALTGVTESFRINCREISGAELEELLSRIEPHCVEMEEKPTEFEVLTAAAYLLFKERGCDIAVVECGMGGSLDATNVIAEPLLSVITNVQKDHCSYLGNTIAEIAAHKAGIIKAGRPVLYGGQADEALDVVKAEAQRLGAPLTVTDHANTTVKEKSLDGTVMDCGELHDLRLSLLGAYQPANADNAVTAAKLLNKLGVKISEQALRKGLENARWPARFELLAKDVIFDGSHNPDGIAYAAKSIKAYYPDRKAVLLMGVMADKEYARYPELLSGCVDRVFAVCPDSPRSLQPRKLAECFASKGIPAEAFDELEAGVAAAYDYASAKGLPLVALGTLYMYDEVKNAIQKLV